MKKNSILVLFLCFFLGCVQSTYTVIDSQGTRYEGLESIAGGLYEKDGIEYRFRGNYTVIEEKGPENYAGN